MRRRRLVAGLVIVLAISAATVVSWHYASMAFGEGIERWAAARRAEGMQASFSELDRQGFPFRLQTTLHDPVLSRPVPSAPWTTGRNLVWEWRGSEVTASIRPWSPSRVDLRFPGTNQITVPFGDRGETIFATADRATGSLDFDGAGAATAGAFNFEELDLLSESGNESVSVASVEVSGAAHAAIEPAHQSATFDFALAAKSIELPTEAKAPLGNFISSVECEASLMGVMPPGPAREAAKAWRDDGGTVEVHRLHLEWGPLVIEAGGTLALDANLQPIGALSAIVRGFAETVDALVAGGVVQQNDATTAKQVLGLLAKAPKKGGPPEITVPVTLQNGWIYVGPVSLARISQIHWE